MLNPNGPFVLLNPIRKLLAGETQVLALSFSPRESVLVSPRPTLSHAAAPGSVDQRDTAHPHVLRPGAVPVGPGSSQSSWALPSDPQAEAGELPEDSAPAPPAGCRSCSRGRAPAHASTMSAPH